MRTVSRLRKEIKSYAKSVVFRNKYLSIILKRKFFGLNNLDKKLLKWVDFKNGFYVELGANDGIAQSNTKHFELFNGWRGVLIEPTPHKFKELKRNRSRRNSFFNCACVSFSFPKNEIELLYSNLMTVALQGENDLANRVNHALAGEKFLKNSGSYKFMAQARSLQDILEESGAPQAIDLMSLDVEGSELEVLKGIDFKRYSFRYILVETRSLEEVKDYLEEKGMRFEEQLSHHDYLFSRIEPLAVELS